MAAEARLLGNRYRLDAVVGRGGMGTVWRAYDVMLDREVAVKEVVLPPGLSDTERAVLYERTFREARASARLNHPGVVTVHDVVEEADRPWIVMELVLAPSLQDLLDRGPMGHRRVAEIGLQMLAALRHAHEKGILHRDVKPSNVLITGAGRVVLTDFGIAQVEGDATLTQTGLVMGSPAYIPPERAQGERAVPASDLWALGATLYAAVEGRSPYERSDAMSSLQAALTEPVPPARNAGPLARVLEGLLAREPVHRMTAAQAQPLLVQVATLPPPPPADATVLDEPSGRFPSSGQGQGQGQGPSRGQGQDRDRDRGQGQGQAPGRPASGRDDEAADTVLDPGEIEAFTRYDAPGGGQRPAPNKDNAPPEPEPRTLVETDWAPPPRPNPRPQQPRPRPRPQPQPQTPPPWEQPSQYTNWQQPPPPPTVDDGPRSGQGEHRKTVLIVTLAVILVIVAVLAGAFILRQKLRSDAMDATRAPRTGIVVTPGPGS